MTQVTKESLAKRIAEIESGSRSLKGDFNLQAFKMLLGYMSDCEHEWYAPLEEMKQQCLKCGSIK